MTNRSFLSANKNHSSRNILKWKQIVPVQPEARMTIIKLCSAETSQPSPRALETRLMRPQVETWWILLPKNNTSQEERPREGEVRRSLNETSKSTSPTHTHRAFSHPFGAPLFNINSEPGITKHVRTTSNRQDGSRKRNF